MRILHVRLEGTESTGDMLFVDLQVNGRFGPIQVTYELDPKTGALLGHGSVNDNCLQRKPTPQERALLLQAFQYFQQHGPTGAEGYPA